MMDRHNHQHCIAEALTAAEDLCAARGARLTDLRRRVLELVWQDHNAVKAYELLEQLGSEGRSSKPPTIYRALEFLLDLGLIHRIESLNAYVGCPNATVGHASQFLICDRCERVEELESRNLHDLLEREAVEHGFHVLHQTVEVHGLCSACSNAALA